MSHHPSSRGSIPNQQPLQLRSPGFRKLPPSLAGCGKHIIWDTQSFKWISSKNWKKKLSQNWILWRKTLEMTGKVALQYKWSFVNAARFWINSIMSFRQFKYINYSKKNEQTLSRLPSKPPPTSPWFPLPSVPMSKFCKLSILPVAPVTARDTQAHEPQR